MTVNGAFTVLAWWVVAGLPLLMLWRFIRVARTTGKPRGFYIGSYVMFLAILVWVPYAYLKRLQGVDLSVAPFLTAHLIGIFSGLLIKRRALKGA